MIGTMGPLEDESGDEQDYHSGHNLACEDIDLNTGAWFGEASLFEADRTCDFSVVAVSESELAVLGAEHYHQIVKKYPRVLARQRNISTSLGTGKLNIDMFAYHEAVEGQETGRNRRSSRLLEFLIGGSAERRAAADVVPMAS